jgi:two-component system alkaline phosphatase synthesis response regulator PhoP
MANEIILIIEDDSDIRELLRYNMEREGYKVYDFDAIDEATNWLSKKMPNLILLDIMLPGKDGLTFCRELKKDERLSHIPVILITARNDDADIVAGLEVGADDYIVKPFSSRVLTARIRTVLRHREASVKNKQEILTYGPFEIDRECHIVKANGKSITLTIGEFNALELFMRRPGVVFSRDQIIDALHGHDHFAADRAIDVLIVGLRKKLGKCSTWIETIRGIGYRMKTS